MIGAPRNLEQNLEDPDYFERAIDISIPHDETKEIIKAKPVIVVAPPTPAVVVPVKVEERKDPPNPEIKQKITQVLGNVGEVYYTPIKALNTFNFDWKIKARVTKKHAKRPWKNAKTEGSVFNIELMDNEGTQIVGTFFNDSAERYYLELDEGQVYTFTGGTVKIANAKYTSVKNDYTIIFDRNSTIERAEDDHKIKNQGFSFVTIEDINDFEQ